MRFRVRDPKPITNLGADGQLVAGIKPMTARSNRAVSDGVLPTLTPTASSAALLGLRGTGLTEFLAPG